MRISAIEDGFKPMLGNNDRIDKKYLINIFSKLAKDEYYLGSIKEDGVRVELFKEAVTSRDIKPIVNQQFNEELQLLRTLFTVTPKEITAIELEVYIPELRFSEINMMLSTKNLDDKSYRKGLKTKLLEGGLSVTDLTFYEKIPDSTVYYMFLANGFTYEKALEELKLSLSKIILSKWSSDILYKALNRVKVVEPIKLYTVEDTLELYESAINLHKEGVVLMLPNKDYKNGRCTTSERHFLKLKPFKTGIAKIINIVERLKNTNESTINELGRKVKRNTLEDKESTGLVGAFICDYNGIEFRLPPSMTHMESKKIWENKDEYIGKSVKFLSMDFGVKTAPRQPVFIEFCE